MLWRWGWIDSVLRRWLGIRDSKCFLKLSCTRALTIVQSTAAGYIEPSPGNLTRILKVDHEIVFTISVPDDKNDKTEKRLTFNELQDKLVNLHALINYFRETEPPTGFDVKAVRLEEGFISSATQFIIHRDKGNPPLLSWQELVGQPLGFSALHRYFHGQC